MEGHLKAGQGLSSIATRRKPLDIEEYERDLRHSASELELLERVFRTGLGSNQLRAALWPYLFGLVKRRGRFARQSSWSCSEGESKFSRIKTAQSQQQQQQHNQIQQQQQQFVYIEHEDNVKRWSELERLYKTYENQWKSIQADQELRFSSFRERKSLIERDVIRSDRTHPFYSSNQLNCNEHLSNLSSLLMTYMMYDFDIGYLQGMSDLAAPILYVFRGDLIKSFWVFVEVMKLFRRNFEFSQKTIHFQLNCLFRLIRLTDPKLATYLRESDCSNCFFVFRHIVCQFKRELMRASSDSQGSTPSESAASSNDEDSFGGSNLSCDSSGAGQQPRDDYANVLNLWDTLWFVQRRHELLAKSKCVHTFKIAQPARARPGAQATPAHKPTCRLYQQQQLQLHQTTRHCKHSKRNNGNHSAKQQIAKGCREAKEMGAFQHDAVSSSARRGSAASLSSSLSSASDSSSSSSARSSSSCSSVASISSSSSASRDSSSAPLCAACCSPTSATSCLADKPKQPQQPQQPQQQQLGTIKQEQVIYTKQTFYSSFDPNQADIPRFKLTETEKFVISLCLSLIRRERNHILKNRLDASEIHQHFIKPRLASDLDQLVGRAYEIYHYLNTECDLQALVRGASEFANPNELSPISRSQSNAARRLKAACTPDEQLASSSAADTYDLLKDYFVVSPTAYNLQMSPLSQASPSQLQQQFYQQQQQQQQQHLHKQREQEADTVPSSLLTATSNRRRPSRLARGVHHFANSTPAIRSNN